MSPCFDPIDGRFLRMPRFQGAGIVQAMAANARITVDGEMQAGILLGEFFLKGAY